MWLALLVLLPLATAADPNGQGLVFPQSACRIRCENGGMCAFSFSDPTVHSCICLLGVYEGERCQYKIGEDPMKKKQEELEEESRIELEEEKRREAERKTAEEARLNEQRRREYEKKIREEEEKKRTQEKQRYEEELRRREDERRREIARREEEQRSRQGAQDERRRGQGAQDEQRRREEQRTREEERRREQLRILQERRRQEEQRRLDEERVREEERRQTMESKTTTTTTAPEENLYSDELTDEDLEPEHPEGEPWELEEEKSTGWDQTTVSDEEEETTVATVTEETATTTTEGPLSMVAKAFEKAAVATAEEHGIDLNAVEEEEEKEKEEDDYWDHHPKKEEEYEVPRIVDSDEEDEIRRDTAKIGEDVREFETEEDGDGWMMLKKADQQSSHAPFCSSSLLMIAIFLRFWI